MTARGRTATSLLRPSAALCLLVCVFSLLSSCGPARQDRLIVGSKNFTEQAVLGEILAQYLEQKTHLTIERKFYLAGTYICQQAILAGRIDLYVEYTGTALAAVLKEPAGGTPAEVCKMVRAGYRRRFHLAVTDPLGFNNTFAIVVRGEDARRLRLRTVTDAVRYATGWRAGFGYEFMERPDGYKGFVRAYNLRFAEPPRIMDLGLLYRALLSKQVDVVAGSSTDGLLSALDLAVLEDDRHYFPPYEAVPVVRQQTLDRHPEVLSALNELAGRITERDMRRLNYEVDGRHRQVEDVVREFLRTQNL